MKYKGKDATRHRLGAAAVACMGLYSGDPVGPLRGVWLFYSRLLVEALEALEGVQKREWQPEVRFVTKDLSERLAKAPAEAREVLRPLQVLLEDALAGKDLELVGS